jgi:hypothetical protein
LTEGVPMVAIPIGYDQPGVCRQDCLSRGW